MFLANLRSRNLPFVTLMQTSLAAGWQIPSGSHSLCVLFTITHCKNSHWNGHGRHYKPLQWSQQSEVGTMVLGALSTHTQELLLPHHCQNPRRTVETHLLFSSTFSFAANTAIPSIDPEAAREVEPSTRQAELAKFLQPSPLCLDEHGAWLLTSRGRKSLESQCMTPVWEQIAHFK